MRQTSLFLFVAVLTAIHCPAAKADSVNAGSLESSSERLVGISVDVYPTLAPIDLGDVLMGRTRNSVVSGVRASGRSFSTDTPLSPDFSSSLIAPVESLEGPRRASMSPVLDASPTGAWHFDHQLRAPGFRNCTPIPLSPAPEPSTIVLFASGLLGVGLKRVLG